MKKVIILLLAGALGIVSCKSEKVEAMNTPMNALRASGLLGQWRFKGYSDGKPPKYDVTLEFKNDDGKLTINGRSSVNFYFAEPDVDETKGSIKVEDFVTTLIAGPSDARAFEDTYYQSLKSVKRYDFRNKNTLALYLSGASNEVLYYERK